MNDISTSIRKLVLWNRIWGFGMGVSLSAFAFTIFRVIERGII